MELSFRELRSSPGSSPPILFSLFDSRITCEKTSFFKGIFKIGIVLKKRFCNPMAYSNGLSGFPPSMNIYIHIEFISGACDIKGLKDDHFAGLSTEILLQCPLVDYKLPFPGFNPNPCNGGLSFTCSVNGFRHFFLLIYKLFVFFIIQGGWASGLRGDDLARHKSLASGSSADPNCF